MKKNYIFLFLALILNTLTFAQTIDAIEPELQTILSQKGNELIDIQIYFKSSVNSDQLNQATRKAYTKSEKKSLVISELKSYAKDIQSDVISILKAEESNGKVSDINSLWISNTISCKASCDVIYKLSSHPDIKVIGYDKEIQLISPEAMKETLDAKPADVRGTFSHVVDVKADQVWNLGFTGKNVIVAVLDSGTNTNHVDLADHLWVGYVDTNNDGTPDTYVNGWNFIGNNSNITDDFGHGTHCAGIVCGDGTSGNITGVAPDAYLMTVKTVNRAGGGSVAQMLKGVQFAVENGADILSMSLGYKNNQITTAQKEEIRAAFDNVLAAGVVVCAAAGNDGNTYGAPNNIDYPAACPAPWRNPDQTLEGRLSSVICVGAHDLNESSRGPATWEGTSYNDYPYNEGESMGLIRPDISAPGYWIYSSKYTINDKYDIKSGTSQATPNVAGVIALMLEKNSTLTPAQISQIIEETASSKPATKNNTVGAGVIDALAAINSITEVVGNPYIELKSFAPATISTGNSTIGVTLENSGTGPSDENTTVTLSLSNDPYVTIVKSTLTAGKIGVDDTKTLYFELDVDKNTPSGHTTVFKATTTSGNLKWEDVFNISVTTAPNLAFQSVSPGVVKINATTDIKVSMVNDGTAAFTDSIRLTLRTIKSDRKYVTLIDSVTTIKPLAAGESGTGTFTLQTKENAREGCKFDFFLETFSEYKNSTNYVYEFENDMQGWTYFNASANSNSTIKKAWWHSSEAAAFEKEAGESYSGNGHLMSNSSLKSHSYTYPINNYLVSPIKITATENSKVSFYARAYSKGLCPEHFGVAISTTGNTSDSDFTLVEEWVITKESWDWTKYTVDLSAYTGQEIYVAIRHFFTDQEWIDTYQGYDVYALNVDDVTFSDVALNITHVSTYSYDDPYYFNVMSSDYTNLPKVENLTATALSSSKISLTWNAVNGASSYNIYRDGQKVASVTEPAYIDKKLAHETNYCYAVTNITSSGESEFSAEECATTLEPTEATAPTNLVATAENGSTIVLIWDEVEEASSYNIYQGTELIAEGLTNTMYIVRHLDAETNYCFSVTAENKLGESDKSEEACATTLEADDEPVVSVPAAPAVTATATSTSEIVLTWSAVEGATSYNVYKGTETLATALTATTYTVTGLTAETTYTFAVSSVNEAGESERTSVEATTLKDGEEPVVPEPTLPATPTLTAEATSTSEIVLTWNKVEGATSYNVYKGAFAIAKGLSDTTYTATGLDYDTEYCFNVTAINEAGESKKSNKVCIKTLGEGIEELNSSINIYPNPVEDKLYIKTEMNVEEVSIYDVYGRQQSTVNGQQSLSIDVAELNSGVYFIKIRTENGETTRRFVKK